MDIEFEEIRKGTTIVSFTALSPHIHGGAKVKYEKPQSA
jgi:hypothetical protein